MTEAEKKQKITERYNRKIDQRIQQQQNALDEAEIDLAVSEKLEDERGKEKHSKRIENIKANIKDLQDLKE